MPTKNDRLTPEQEARVDGIATHYLNRFLGDEGGKAAWDALRPAVLDEIAAAAGEVDVWDVVAKHIAAACVKASGTA